MPAPQNANPIHAILTALLRPVVRACLRHSVGYQEVSELLKGEFVAQAQQSTSSGETSNVSRVSVMTGLNRREVARLFRGGSAKQARISLAARTLSQWQNDRRFCNPGGKPKLLSTGADSEFHALVASVSTDVNPSSVLAELKRIGAVERVRNGVKLAAEHHSLHASPAQGLSLLADDIETLTDAVDENVYGNLADSGNSRNLHLRTEFDNVFVEDVPAIRQKLVELGSKLHRELRALLTEHDKDLRPDRDGLGGGKVVLGTFSWTATPGELAAAPQQKPGRKAQKTK